MAAKIHHWPAPAFFLFDEPMPGMPRFRIKVLERVDLREGYSADLAERDDLFDTGDSRIKPAVVRNAQFHSVRATSRDHLVALVNGQCHRFFAKDMLSG